MEVILIDDVYRLGRRGEVVSVHDGYGRNFLIPQKLAIPATSGNLKNIELQKTALAKKETRHRDEAELLTGELAQKHIIISRKAGDTGVLFGSVGTKDIAGALESAGIYLDRRKILLSAPVKAIGTLTVVARPHADVEASLLVSVLPETDEPIARVIDRGVESDQIIEALEEKIGESRREERTPAAGPVGEAAAGNVEEESLQSQANPAEDAGAREAAADAGSPAGADEGAPDDGELRGS